MRMKWTSLLAALALAAVLTACNEDSTGSGLQPIPAVGTPVTETFTGTVQVKGAAINTFQIIVSGNVAITLAAAGPPATITMALAIGTPATTGTTTTCTPLTGGSVNATAGTTPQLSGAVQAGNYCISVTDIGNATGPVTYTVTVNHT